ncbi:MAG: hypothetical protein EOM91_16870 [Sphingobacteriia bacterium]|nr:hypothetical protein [Sphingobacteriia bacterium]
MAVLVAAGRAALAEVIRSRPLHLAWGVGDSDWDTSAIPESVDAVALLTEIGRVPVSATGYAVEDAEGPIETPTGRWSLVEARTPNLYLKFDFGFADAPDALIREVGLFMDTEIASGLPAGQRYFEPGDIADAGTLIAVEHFPAVVRSPLIRQQFEFVLTI